MSLGVVLNLGKQYQSYSMMFDELGPQAKVYGNNITDNIVVEYVEIMSADGPIFRSDPYIVASYALHELRTAAYEQAKEKYDEYIDNGFKVNLY